MCNTCIGPTRDADIRTLNPRIVRDRPQQAVKIFEGKLTTCYKISWRIVGVVLSHAMVLKVSEVLMPWCFTDAMPCLLTCNCVICHALNYCASRDIVTLSYCNTITHRVLPEWSEFRPRWLNTFRVLPEWIEPSSISVELVWVMNCLWWSVMTLSHLVIV